MVDLTSGKAPISSSLTQAESRRPAHRAITDWIVVPFVLLWFAALGAMVVFTSNPVTVNVRQLSASEAVAHVRILDRSAGRCEVLEDLWGGLPRGELLVGNIEETAAVEGGEYFLPLRLTSSGWVVTSVPATSDWPYVVPPTIYPATPETRRFLEAAK